MMSLTPDDMPEDPFAATGRAQLLCTCTNDTFHFVYETTLDGQHAVQAVCVSCHRVMGTWPRQPGDTPLPAEPFHPGPEGPAGYVNHAVQQITREPDGLPDWEREIIERQYAEQQAAEQMAREPQARAGWLPEGAAPPPPPGPPGTLPDWHGKLPPLQAFSDGVCNALLNGGPYGGRITWIMPGADRLTIDGIGSYRQADAEVEGRRVYDWEGSEDAPL